MEGVQKLAVALSGGKDSLTLLFLLKAILGRGFPEMDVVNDALVGEDEYFCYYAREAGYDVFCDMELSTEIGHIGSNVFYISAENTIVTPAKVDEIL